MHITAAICANMPPDSATVRELGEGWDMHAHLLAAVIDKLAEANWQRTTDGSKGHHHPKPIPRPGVEDKKTQKVGNGSMSLKEAKAWLDRRRGRIQPDAEE